jgi:hypothetical protein
MGGGEKMASETQGCEKQGMEEGGIVELIRRIVAMTRGCRQTPELGNAQRGGGAGMRLVRG